VTDSTNRAGSGGGGGRKVAATVISKKVGQEERRSSRSENTKLLGLGCRTEHVRREISRAMAHWGSRENFVGLCQGLLVLLDIEPGDATRYKYASTKNEVAMQYAVQCSTRYHASHMMVIYPLGT
jgi:hypothetical protein